MHPGAVASQSGTPRELVYRNAIAPGRIQPPQLPCAVRPEEHKAEVAVWLWFGCEQDICGKIRICGMSKLQTGCRGFRL